MTESMIGLGVGAGFGRIILGLGRSKYRGCIA